MESKVNNSSGPTGTLLVIDRMSCLGKDGDVDTNLFVPEPEKTALQTYLTSTPMRIFQIERDLSARFIGWPDNNTNLSIPKPEQSSNADPSG